MAVDDKNLVLQHLDLSWNKGEFEKIKDFLAERFFYKTTFTDEILTTDEYIHFIKEMRKALPDLKVVIELIMSEDNHVMTQKSFFGQVHKPIYGIPASNKIIAFSVVSIWEVENGRIASLDTLIDLSGIERQTGVDVTPQKPLKIR